MIRIMCPNCRNFETVHGNKTVFCPRCHFPLFVASRPMFTTQIKLALLVPTVMIILVAILRLAK